MALRRFAWSSAASAASTCSLRDSFLVGTVGLPISVSTILGASGRRMGSACGTTVFGRSTTFFGCALGLPLRRPTSEMPCPVCGRVEPVPSGPMRTRMRLPPGVCATWV